MSNEDRARRAFDDLRAQTAGIEPPGIASDLQRLPRTYVASCWRWRPRRSRFL